MTIAFYQNHHQWGFVVWVQCMQRCNVEFNLCIVIVFTASPESTHSNEISVINYTVRWLDEQSRKRIYLFSMYSNADMYICSLLRRLAILFIDLLSIDHCNVYVRNIWNVCRV